MTPFGNKIYLEINKLELTKWRFSLIIQSVKSKIINGEKRHEHSTT